MEVNSCAFLLSRYFFTVDTSMSGSWLVSCFNKYVGVRNLYSPSCWLSNKWSAHLRIVCSKSSPASTPEVLISYTELNANNFQSNTLSNTVHTSLHRALRSLKPIDLTSLNDFGVIGMGLAVYRGSVLRFCTLWHSFFIYLIVYLCTETPTACKVSCDGFTKVTGDAQLCPWVFGKCFSCWESTIIIF